MGKGKSRKMGLKCQRYSNEKRRVKNKTRKLLKRIKNIKEETRNKILSHCKIGRKYEK